MKRSGYMKWYFLRMLSIILVLVGVLVFALTNYSKVKLRSEIISLHQSILGESVGKTSAVLHSFTKIVDDIAEDAGVIRWLTEGEDEIEEIDTFIKNEIYGDFEQGSRFRIYIYDLDELRYSSDYPEISINEAMAVLKEDTSTVAQENGIYIKGPVKSDTETGLYGDSFYIVRPVIDHLSGEVQGYLLMQLSEVALYDSYKNLINKDRDYHIIDGENTVLSAKNKKEIGEKYSRDKIIIENTEPLGEGYSISEDSRFAYFYKNISGTEWFLLETAQMGDIMKSVNQMIVLSILMMGIFSMCFIPMTFYFLRPILKEIGVIKDRMGDVAKGNLKARIADKEKGEGELAEISDSFNYMVGKLEKQVEEIQEIERKRHQLQLNFLQTQINPHFIYNTLSSIRFYVEMGQNEEAEKMLIDFSKILRKTLSSTEKFITLEEEIETLKYYIDLQKARYRERFEVVFDIPENTLTCIVPDFILQPIVENAIFYSLREKEVCHVWIRSYINSGTIYISVKDDGIGMDKDTINNVLDKGLNMNKVGIRNVNDRIQLNFGEEYGLEIQSCKGEGTEVIMKIPAMDGRKGTDEDINR